MLQEKQKFNSIQKSAAGSFILISHFLLVFICTADLSKLKSVFFSFGARWVPSSSYTGEFSFVAISSRIHR